MARQAFELRAARPCESQTPGAPNARIRNTNACNRGEADYNGGKLKLVRATKA